MRARLWFDGRHDLAEGPVWLPRQAVLAWVDILAGELHTADADGGRHRVTRFDTQVGAVAPRAGGRPGAAGTGRLPVARRRPVGRAAPAVPGAAAGRPGQRRRLLPGGPLPDGMAVDADGALWAAVNLGGGAVRRYAPDGRLLESVEVPVPDPTSCAFGVPDLAILYVTSMRKAMDAQSLARCPTAGGVFVCQPGSTGTNPWEYAG